MKGNEMTSRKKISAVALAAVILGVAVAAVVSNGAATADGGYQCGVDREAEPIEMNFVGRYSATGAPGGETAAEIVAYDRKVLYVLNYQSVDVVDLRIPANPVRLATLTVPRDPTSVAASRGLVAVSVPGEQDTENGSVHFFYRNQPVATVAAGSLPDMVTFTPDGHHLLVANEGEPNSYGLADSVDPEGSVTIIKVDRLRRLPRPGKPVVLKGSEVRTVRFTSYNAGGSRFLAPGVRIFGPGSSVAQDLEPEYITVSSDSRYAWVSLQENNALAKINIDRARVIAISALGSLDHSLPGNGLDASDKDVAISIRNWPVRGLFQPDGIAHARIRGRSYVLTANEGDAREWPGIIPSGSDETVRAKSGADLTMFPDAAADSALGRLKVSRVAPASLDGNGKATSLYSYGTRSFSIRDDRGRLVWDSGDDFECVLSTELPTWFNTTNSDDKFDDRSDDKGPEPESVVVGSHKSRTYAFVGLERVGGVMVYDITRPKQPKFERYITTRVFDGLPVGPDSGPEGMVFVPAHQSATRKPLLVYGNETTGTVAIWELSS